MALTGHTDKGFQKIMREIQALKDLSVKVGVVAGTGANDEGVLIAQYAALNELGTDHIPSRPFIRGWIDNNRSLIQAMTDNLYALVLSGNMTAAQAAERLGQFAASGIQEYIRKGNFKPNSAITIYGTPPGKNGNKFIKGKGEGKRPLIDTGTLRASIRHQVIKQ